jgi:hypothetical protein
MTTFEEERQERRREWEESMSRIDSRLRRTEEIQKSWQRHPATLIDAASSLCDASSPPPTTEELLWLKEKLTEHQTSVEKLIELVSALLIQQSGADVAAKVSGGGENQPDGEEE